MKTKKAVKYSKCSQHPLPLLYIYDATQFHHTQAYKQIHDLRMLILVLHHHQHCRKEWKDIRKGYDDQYIPLGDVVLFEVFSIACSPTWVHCTSSDESCDSRGIASVHSWDGFVGAWAAEMDSCCSDAWICFVDWFISASKILFLDRSIRSRKCSLSLSSPS